MVIETVACRSRSPRQTLQHRANSLKVTGHLGIHSVYLCVQRLDGRVHRLDSRIRRLDPRIELDETAVGVVFE